MRSSGTACARSPTPSPASCAWRAATSTTSPTPTPSSPASTRRSARTAPCSTARSSPSTPRPPELRGAAAAHAHGVARAGAAPGEGHAGDVRDLRPAVARRPLADGAALQRAARAAGGAGAEGRELADARARRRPGRAAAGGERRAGARGRRRQAPELDLPAGRALARVGQGQDARAPGARGRRLDGGQGQAPARRIGALLLGVYEPGGVLRYAGRVGSGFDEDELERCRGCSRRCERADLAVRRRRAARRAGRSFCEPRLVAEVEFTSGPAPAACATPSYKGLREDKPRGAGRARGHARGASPTDMSSIAIRADPRAAEGEALGALSIRRRGASAADATVEGRELKLSNLDKVLYPATRLHQGRADRLLRGRRAGAARPPPAAGADGHALARRRRGQVVLPEAGASAPPRLGAAP